MSTETPSGDGDGCFTLILLILIWIQCCAANDKLRDIQHSLEQHPTQVEAPK